MSKKTNTELEGDIFELGDSEHVLNLDFYLHRSILKWQDAIESALKQEKNIETGLINRGLAGDMVVGIAKAKNLIHWDEQPVPEKEDKHRANIIKFNEEAKDFNKRYDAFKKNINEQRIDENIKKVKLADFKVFEILLSISKSSTKKGTVIV